MPFYHATHRRKLPSILQFGLGGRSGADQNFACKKGVYLAATPEVAFAFLIEHFLESAIDESNPNEELDEFVVILVDDTRIVGNLQSDPQVSATWAGCFVYDGVIDIRGMPVLDAQLIFPDFTAGTGRVSQDSVVGRA
jgi:hypothetical protein